MDKNGRTPLHDAALAGSEDSEDSEDTFSWLIGEGADVKVVDKDGRTPLHDAARAGSRDTIRRLIGEGADVKAVDKDGRTPLHDAARAGSRDTVSWLIRQGADVKAADKDGRTPLHDAARAGSRDTIRRLILKGADVKVVDKDGRTPLHDAARAGSRDTIRWLIGEGADVKAADKDGRTPLHDAARAGSPNAIRELLRGGADINTADKDERTALYDASRGSLDDAVRCLVSYGAYTAALDRGKPKLLQHFHHKFLSEPAELLQDNWKLLWGGLDTYTKSNGALGNILTITRLQCNRYVARSLSDFLDEFHGVAGTRILEWVICLCRNSPRRQTTTLFSEGQVDSEVSEFPLIQTGSSNQDEFVTMTGYLEDKQLTLRLATNSKVLAVEVKSALAWILCAMQPAQDKNGEGLFSFSLDKDPFLNGLPEPEKFNLETQSCCWTGLFRYAAIITRLPPTNSDKPTPDGLEIDIDLLMELGAVDREMRTDSGFVLYGFDTALVPLDPPESRRWHFIVTEGKQITPMRVRSKLKQLSGNTLHELGDEYRSGKVYVGWSNGPDIDCAEKVMRPSGVERVKKLEVRTEKNTSQELSISPRVGISGSSIGGSFARKRDEKIKQAITAAKRTPDGNFERILDHTGLIPCMLWDQLAQKAWLHRATSVLLFASLRYIDSKGYTFKRKAADEQFEPATVSYAQDRAVTAADVIRENALLLVDKARGRDVKEDLSFQGIVRYIWEGMALGEDVCSDDQSKVKLANNGFLYGYDLVDAISSETVYLRELKVTSMMEGWLALVQGDREHIIFCSGIGTMLTSNCVCAACVAERNGQPKGVLTCLLKDLRFFYGGKWDLSHPNLRALPIGSWHEWTPRKSNLAGCICYSRMIQTISPKPKTNKLKKELRGPGLSLPDEDTILSFGCLST